MESAEQLGRKASYLSPKECEQLRDLWVDKIKSEQKNRQAQHNCNIEVLTEKEREILAELRSRGNVSREAVRESLRRGIWLGFLLIFSSAGEFFFAYWTISFFSLGQIVTLLVSTTFLIVCLEGMDQYLTAFRKQYPGAEDRMFLVLGCIGFVLIIVLILVSAEIRESLQETLSAIGAGDSLESTLGAADRFYSTKGRTYLFLMATLALSFTLVGGMSYHLAKNRILFSSSSLRLYRALDQARAGIQLETQYATAEQGRVETFKAEFEAGLVNEKADQARAEKAARGEPLGDNTSDQAPEPANARENRRNNPNWALIAAFPVTLLLIAFLLFVLFTGRARASDTIIFLDISGSTRATDYKGAETEFDKNLRGIETYLRSHAAPGDSIRVLGLTESSFSKPFMISEAVIPKKKGRFGEVIARARLDLVKNLQGQDLQASAPATDIFGAVSLANILFMGTGANTEKRLLFFSDMRQCTHELNLEGAGEIDVDRAISRVKAMGLIPELTGVSVWCLGVHSSGRSSSYWLSLKNFWIKYFAEARAKVVNYSMERRWQR